MARSIIFIKTHKCASTTIQNCLASYAEENKFNVLSPHKWGGNDSPYSEQTLTFRFLLRLKAPFHININHSPYEDYLRRAIPGAICITSVRDPLARAISHFYSFLHSSAPLPFEKTFPCDFNEYYPLGFSDGALGRERVKLGMDNYMARWLGYRTEDEITESSLRDRYFFIGIAEQMKKTMSILSRITGIQHDSSPTRINANVEYEVFKVSEEVRDAFIARNGMDYKLYHLSRSIFDAYSPADF